MPMKIMMKQRSFSFVCFLCQCTSRILNSARWKCIYGVLKNISYERNIVTIRQSTDVAHLKKLLNEKRQISISPRYI